MAKTSIPWTHYTFNPWWGCVKITPGCDHCYAAAFAKRTGHDVWGKDNPRRFFGEALWSKPLKWNAAAVAAGERQRVFCASMADVFEGRPDQAEHRRRLWRTIRATPALDWLLLTKRPGSILPLLYRDVVAAEQDDKDGDLAGWLHRWSRQETSEPPANVWIGTTVEDHKRAEERIPLLVCVPAVVRFLSMEPLLERVNLEYACFNGSDSFGQLPGIDWLIVGGESGGGSRPFNVEWARELRTVADRAGVAFFMKQVGARPFEAKTASASKSGKLAGGRFSFNIVEAEITTTWKPTDAKGEAIADLPADLRIREFPKPRGAT